MARVFFSLALLSLCLVSLCLGHPPFSCKSHNHVMGKIVIRNQARNMLPAALRLHGLAMLLTVGLLAASSPAMASDILAGPHLFAAQCGKCHMVGIYARHGRGPHLNAIIGRRAATQKGFGKYSAAMIRAGRSGLEWNDANLDAFLKAPAKFLRKTTMKYPGLATESGRQAIIAYLKKFTPGENANARLEKHPDLPRTFQK